LITHLPFGVVADDGRAAQSLENADLNFLRPERDEPIETRAEALHVFAGQADDEIGVDMDARRAAQEVEVILEPAEILSRLINSPTSSLNDWMPTSNWSAPGGNFAMSSRNASGRRSGIISK
jgi:hypothetical protein